MTKVVHVRYADGTGDSLEVDQATDCLQLKRLIEDEKGIPIECQTLYDGDEMVENDEQVNGGQVLRVVTILKNPDSLCCEAATKGNLEMLKWARENGCPWDGRTCVVAAFHGHLEMLKWARENGCPWDECTCAVAAQNGHLEMLKWARENGCPWDVLTCTYAAGNGHLEVLKWARENGCPWDFWTSSLARWCRHLEVLKWALENGCPEQ